MPSIQLGGLQTESRNFNSKDIDQVSTTELCRIINNEDASVAAAVEKCIPAIAAAIDALAVRGRLGGRVIYVGAGTSGRFDGCFVLNFNIADTFQIRGFGCL